MHTFIQFAQCFLSFILHYTNVKIMFYDISKLYKVVKNFFLELYIYTMYSAGFQLLKYEKNKYLHIYNKLSPTNLSLYMF